MDKFKISQVPRDLARPRKFSGTFKAILFVGYIVVLWLICAATLWVV